MESSFISVIQLRLWTRVLNKCNAHRLKWFKSLVLLMWWFWSTFNKNPPIHYLNKLEYFHKTNKKMFFSKLFGLLWKVCSFTVYVLNTLVGASCCFNYCINSAMAMEVISLWHCWGGMEAQVSLTVAFSSSAFFGLLFLIFHLTIPHRFSMGFRSGEFAGQSSTPTPWSFN